jgi:ABC-type glutathione transport system ATPase component
MQFGDCTFACKNMCTQPMCGSHHHLAICARTQVVGSSSQRFVSGGQRRRAAIGVELVAKPCLLYLDEPTSGLDAAVAADVVGALKKSADRGMNVIAVMHQPR